ncbi:MAG: hypothetical protein SWQ30_01275 [Thermodesulfobacteriota bacterium]|nr:hypothetical protein [Thermodesulfobacteriota bacterium]
MVEKINWRGAHSSAPSARRITQASHNHSSPKEGRAFFRQLHYEANDDKEENRSRADLHPSDMTHGEREGKRMSLPQHSKDESDNALGAPGDNGSPRRLDVLA